MMLWTFDAQDGGQDAKAAPPVIVDASDSHRVVAVGANFDLGDAAMGGVHRAIEGAKRIGARAIFSGSGGATRAWMHETRTVLDAACDGILEELRERSIEWWMIPRVGDVLSDIPSSLGFLRSRQGQPFGLLLDPAALLTESMLRHWVDHVERSLEAIGAHEACRAIVLHNVGEQEGDSVDARLALTGLEEGRLSGASLLSRAVEVPGERSLIVERRDVTEVRARLSMHDRPTTLPP